MEKYIKYSMWTILFLSMFTTGLLVGVFYGTINTSVWFGHNTELLEQDIRLDYLENSSKNIDYECKYKLMNLTNYYDNEIYRLILDYETR